jgi:peptidoglycan-associated lipoprotein
MSNVRLATTLAVLLPLGIGLACVEPQGPTPQQLEEQRKNEDAAREAAEREAREAAEREARRAAEEARRAAEEAKRAEEARRAAEAREAMIQASLAALLDVNFDYNKADVRRPDRIKLEAIAEFMKAFPQATVRIEGHCDERGTIEYNIALGERRAYAVKSYLVGLGVDESRFGTVSFGKERPKVQGQSEKSWFANRRCEFKLQ